MLVGGTVGARNVFWLAKKRKKINFSGSIHVFDLVLKFCSGINEGIGIQLFFYFYILVNKVASFKKLSFFVSELVFRLKTLRVAVSRKRLQLDSKTDLTTNGIVLEIFNANLPRFAAFLSAWTEIGKNSSNGILC